MQRTVVLLFVVMCLRCVCLAGSEDPLARRWVLLHTNLMVDKNVEDAMAILKRAEAVGYNGVVVDDFKFNILDRMTQHYFDNARRVGDKAHELGLTLAVTCMNLGWSSGILIHDPNLAEGIPVKDMRYVVAERVAHPAHDPQVVLPGGGFEEVRNGRLTGWDWYDDPGKCTFADTQIVHGGAVSARMEHIGEVNQYGNCRFCKKVSLRPFYYYHLSAWLKTQDFAASGNVRMQVLAGDKLHAIAYPDMNVKPTQDWTQYHAVFNSLNYETVNIYVGVWGGTTGTLWWDEVKLEESGPVSLLRRQDTPLMIKGEDGTLFKESEDYEPVVDPKLASFDQVHEAPLIRLTANSRIKEGQRLLLSFYHPGIIGVDDVMCCLSDPRVYDIMRDGVRRTNSLMHPDVFFMGHDEIRCANWDPPCQARGKTPGQLLAENATRCVRILREIAPKAEIAVWSDMFDPFHNAGQDLYYLVNGSWKGSWEGLDPGVTIMNWYSTPAPKNNQFFADRGHRQILCGYYDTEPGHFYDPAWLEKTKGVRGVIGVMYTPWSTGYGRIEAWAQAVWGGKH